MDDFYKKIGAENNIVHLFEKEKTTEEVTAEHVENIASELVGFDYLNADECPYSYDFIIVTDGMQLKKDAQLIFTITYAQNMYESKNKNFTIAYIHCDDERVKKLVDRYDKYPYIYCNESDQFLGDYTELTERGKMVDERKAIQEVKTLEVVRLNENAVMPTYGSQGAAALDLYSSENIVLLPDTTTKVSTGISIALPKENVGRIAPRSGLSLKSIDTRAGVIDEDYRGEVCVFLRNEGIEPYTVNAGDRIAQLIVQPITLCYTMEVKKLPDTKRGGKGFGSTGI